MTSVEPNSNSDISSSDPIAGAGDRLGRVLKVAASVVGSMTAVVIAINSFADALPASLRNLFGSSSRSSAASCASGTPVAFDTHNAGYAVRINHRPPQKGNAEALNDALRRAGFQGLVTIEAGLDNVPAPDKSPGVVWLRANAHGGEVVDAVRGLVLAVCPKTQDSLVRISPDRGPIANGDLQIDLF